MTPQTVLKFWFEDLTLGQHFVKDRKIDRLIKKKFIKEYGGFWTIVCGTYSMIEWEGRRMLITNISSMKREYYIAAWVLLIVYTAALVVMLVGVLREGSLLPSAMIVPFLLFLPSYVLATFIQRRHISAVLLIASIIISAIPVVGIFKFGPANLFVAAVFIVAFLAMVTIFYVQHKDE